LRPTSRIGGGESIVVSPAGASLATR
jgi:hypothetical protein